MTLHVTTSKQSIAGTIYQPIQSQISCLGIFEVYDTVAISGIWDQNTGAYQDCYRAASIAATASGGAPEQQLGAWLSTMKPSKSM